MPVAMHRKATASRAPQPPAWAVTGLFVLAVVAALYLARDVVVPIVLALIPSVVLRPAVRDLARLRVPAVPGAGLVVLALYAGLLGHRLPPGGARCGLAGKAPLVSRRQRHAAAQHRAVPVQGITQGRARTTQGGTPVPEAACGRPDIGSPILTRYGALR